jgi:L-alanine-DL-glutamate epimerase-like enolase superfamily enzyme
MKITSIDLIEVLVPYIDAIRAVDFQARSYTTIAKVHTDAGLTGLGERWQRKETLAAQVEALIGGDLLTMDLAHLDRPFQSACYDIVAQGLGVPVWRLLGDKIRNRIPVSYWSCHMPPEETAKEAERAAAQGFKIHKLKAFPEDVVRQVDAITRATAGVDYAIRLDPEGKFRSVADTVKLARQLEPYNIDCFENPVSWQNLTWYPLLRQKTDIPQALHLIDAQVVLNAVRAEAADLFNLSGNVNFVKKAAAIAEVAQCPIWLQTGGLCLGVQAAFSAHLQSTLPNDLRACGELPFLREDSLVGDSLEIKDGHIAVPEGPGLGIELDEKAVAKYRTG